ncbi:hypothetical protein FS837_012971 [Tulasnella sp. UAMH 9824]|nr:hypothetical protein FS837_012971 [Tulasnella sp. UAMH 9824]
MSPTAQPDERTPATAKTVLPLPASSSNASGSSGAADRKPIPVNEIREEPLTTVVLISNAYPKCTEEKKGCDVNGKEKTELKPSELQSVRNDRDILLTRHDTYNGKLRVFVCTDFPYEYEESENIQVRGASKSDILDCLVEAVSLGGSLVIYSARFNNGRWEYEGGHAKKEGTKKDEATKPELSYIISGEFEHIYGKDVAKALSAGLERNGWRKMRIMLIFDTCTAATFFGMKLDPRSLMSLLTLSAIVDDALALPYVYRPEAFGGLKVEPHGEAKYGESQIIFLASTQLHQGAGTFEVGEAKKQYGAVTLVMSQFLQDPKVPKTAEKLIEMLYDACKERQTPQIRASHRINNLRMLLG